MKTVVKRVTAMLLVMLMCSISPLHSAAPIAHAEGDDASVGAEETSDGQDAGDVESDTSDGQDADSQDKSKDEDKSDDDDIDNNVYISEVRIGMGETEAEAKSELESEGFTILTDDSGALADLNVDAGSASALKRGANDKIVYLGYKTTTDIDDAVTDLAVMNMNGGYSIEDYNLLMDQQMNSQIKPFVDSFIATLEEYRANYKKPATSINHIRADYMRKALNKFTDDDTGGQPMGDILLNKTKYEMGDAAYNSLSDAEKKNHCDILTLLMESNGQASMALKKLVSRAADTSDDTWLGRFTDTTLDDLMEEVEREDASLTSQTDILDALDRKYNDNANLLLNKWNEFQSQIIEYEDKADELEYNEEETNNKLKEAADSLKVDESEDMTEEDIEQISDNLSELSDAQVEATSQVYDSQIVAIAAYLESVEYEDDTLFDFFARDYDEVSTDSGIRSLYPIVASFSAGQEAGFDFLSITELFSIALSDENTYQAAEEGLEKTDPASVYEGVDREIYEKGGVALTSDSLRAKALSDQQDSGYRMGTLPIVFWGVTAGFAAATVVSAVITATVKKTVTVTEVVKNTVTRTTEGVARQIAFLEKQYQIYGDLFNNSLKSGDKAMMKVAGDRVKSIADQISGLKNNTSITTSKTVIKTSQVTNNVAKYLSIGFAVITVIMTVVSTTLTLLDASAYYDTEYTPIPRYMVDRADITSTNRKGEEVMDKNPTAYYRVVRCNRNAGNNDITKKNYEIMGDSNDLKGDIGKQWLALYSVKYEYGSPILADSLKYQKGDGSLPDGYSTGIHEFGSKPATNLNKTSYLFVDDAPAIKVYFKKAVIEGAKSLKSEGSIFSGGAGIALGGGVGLVVGALFGGLIVSRRKKNVDI